MVERFSVGAGRRSVDRLEQGLLLRGQPVRQVFGQGVDEDESGLVGGMSTGVKPPSLFSLSDSPFSLATSDRLLLS
jgi:hypothetical protein